MYFSMYYYQFIRTVHFLFSNFNCYCIVIDYSPCGVSPVDFRARMVGGKNSNRGWWPWQIGLYKNNYEALIGLYNNNNEGKLKSEVVVFVCSEYGKNTSYIKH